MAVRIIPQIIRGRLFYQIADVLFPTFAQAAGAWSRGGSPSAQRRRRRRCEMSSPTVTVEILLRQAHVFLQEADAMNAAGDPKTYTLQRQARETLAAALDIVEVARA